VSTFESARLRLRPMNLSDAEFILTITNDPSWLQFIGDRGVHTIEDAKTFIIDGPLAMYKRLGIGSLIVELKETNMAIGSCGLLQRDYLEFPDIGYAFLPEYRAKGYAFEAASAVLEYYYNSKRFSHVCAIVSHDNMSSIRLLTKLGFSYQATIALDGGADEVCLYQSTDNS
jgi:RimJ/RimL family protein N-acetyltransferase